MNFMFKWQEQYLSASLQAKWLPWLTSQTSLAYSPYNLEVMNHSEIYFSKVTENQGKIIQLNFFIIVIKKDFLMVNKK